MLSKIFETWVYRKIWEKCQGRAVLPNLSKCSSAPVTAGPYEKFIGSISNIATPILVFGAGFLPECSGHQSTFIGQKQSAELCKILKELNVWQLEQEKIMASLHISRICRTYLSVAGKWVW